MEESIYTIITQIEEHLDAIKSEFSLNLSKAKSKIIAHSSSIDYLSSELVKKVKSDKFKNCPEEFVSEILFKRDI